MYDSRSNLNSEILANIGQVYTGRVFKSVIRYGVAAAEAPGQGVPVRLYARNSPVARCYQELAQEIVADETAARRGGWGRGKPEPAQTTAPEPPMQEPAAPTGSADAARPAQIRSSQAPREAKS